MNSSQVSVIFTGFGPFKGHEEKNASWEAVKLLPDEILVDGIKHQTRKIEIAVTYEKVDMIIPELWNLCPQVSFLLCGARNWVD